MSFAAREREALAVSFLEHGPTAPTLCEGWNAHDLLVHLVVRERYPEAAAGMFLNPLRSVLEKRTQEMSATPFPDLLAQWREGAYRGGTKNPRSWLDPLMNATEHWVHHEDLRRGAWQKNPREFANQDVVLPRRLDEQDAKVLHRAVRLLAKQLKNDKPVVLEAYGYAPIVAADRHGVAEKGDNVLRVRGELGELLLWLFGRDAVRLEIEGDVNKLKRSSL